MDQHSGFANRIRSGRPVIGTWMQIPSPIVAETMAQTGFDFILLDGEHAPVPPDLLYTLLPSTERYHMPVLYRVRSNKSDLIKAALDAGATGLIVPMVNSASEAAQAVASAKYPPTGKRGFGPWRASNYYENDVAYLASANEAALVVQIETKEGLAAVDEIAAVPGIDALYVGPADISMSLGLPLGQLSDGLRQACERVGLAARQNKIAAGVDVASLDYVPDFRGLGFSLFTYGLDTSYLIGGGRESSAALRRACDEQEPM